MPQLFALNVPDVPTAQRVVTALCAVHGYQPNLADPANPGQTVPNPETPAAFARRMVLEHLRDTTAAYEASQLARPAPPAIA